MLDEVEKRVLGPVDVLEHEHERLRLRELLRPRARRPGELLAAPLALHRGQDPGGQAQQVGDRLDLAGGAQLLERLLGRVVVGDACSSLDHLGQRPVRHPLAIRERPAGEHRGAVEARDELAREPALPDTGVAVDGEEVRAAVAKGAVVRVREQLELGVAPHERSLESAPPRRPLAHADGLPRPHGRAAPLQLERTDVLRLDAVVRQPVGAGADQDLARPCRLLEPRGDVDRLAGRERGLALVGDDLARLDADPRLELELGDGVHDRESRTDRPLGVVLVCAWDPERGHHRVAGELLDGAAVAQDAARDALEEARDAPPHDLGVVRRHELRRLDEIDEDDGRQLPLYHRSIVR